MQRLLLIRHAKAAAFGVEPGDHCRPLTDKGKKQAQDLGGILAKANWMPDLAIVSSAQRTNETWKAMAFDDCPAHYEETLYLASPKTLTQIAIQHGRNDQTLALVGHNPGIAMLAYQLIEEGFDHNVKAVQALSGNFKTGWAAAFDLREDGPNLVRLFDPRNA